jgi:hypothetical protein
MASAASLGQSVIPNRMQRALRCPDGIVRRRQQDRPGNAGLASCAAETLPVKRTAMALRLTKHEAGGVCAEGSNRFTLRLRD